jgi:hypothetical protein
LDVDGAGQSLTSETMTAFAEMLRHADPDLQRGEARFRVWALTAVIHQCGLRPDGCTGWLGVDPPDKRQRDPLLERLCDFARVPAET